MWWFALLVVVILLTGFYLSLRYLIEARQGVDKSDLGVLICAAFGVSSVPVLIWELLVSQIRL